MALLPEVTLDSDEQKASYGFGLQFGEQLRRSGFDGLELEAVLAGVQHWYHHQEAVLADAEINPSYQIIHERQEAKAAELSKKREALAEKFLVANAARAEVSTTASGLQHEVLESGDAAGPSPNAQSTLSCTTMEHSWTGLSLIVQLTEASPPSLVCTKSFLRGPRHCR